MRRIKKQQPPEPLRSFIERQLAIDPEPVNLTYNNFRSKAELLAILTSEQFGLCGYTGAPVDERISSLSNPSGKAKFGNHIEHLKSQEKCKQELIDSGRVYGRDLGDDLDYFNMIAAMAVKGCEREHFGAVAKMNRPLPVLPTQERCDEHFRFSEFDGGIEGLTQDGAKSIHVLQLDHRTLAGWRKSAIDVWLDPAVIQTRKDIETVAQAMELPIDGKLPEFAFVIGAIAKGYFDEANLGSSV
jgi:hypothetical protein